MHIDIQVKLYNDRRKQNMPMNSECEKEAFLFKMRHSRLRLTKDAEQKRAFYRHQGYNDDVRTTRSYT